ncbi:hypothetical protein APUTEX25_005751 [Auxenochlorella protothecoides]|uniref:Uncharacterized protein n=1 Tax=Auxenochlorella protothecoides TaxID=3075 RepID=A0A1D1ZUD7_AUXPR|nr:hypothetical protein APUTEX25_005751 [Auxenochlorella protothecoides]|eukprot:RMZ55710.1 hypothetical protein APUTEX25_005751 [Auxenochlorella protothecoides]
MARPGGQRGSRGQPPKRKKRDEFFEDEDAVDFFEDAGDNQAGEEADEGEPSSDEEETAEQKRLRLAKEYLAGIRAVEAAGRDGAEDGASDEDGLDAAVDRRLRQDAAEAMGWAQRALAARVVLPEGVPRSIPGQKLHRGHSQSVTALALTADDRTLYSVSKDGTILRHDIESGNRERMSSGAAAGPSGAPAAHWVVPGARQTSRAALLACAVSSDGVYVAAGGGSRVVHVWDTRAGLAPIKSFPGHKDAVTALAFRLGTHELFSGSLDRSVKLWSLDDLAYVDSLFGHQAEVLALDALRTERVLSVGGDRTCRLWKIPEETQLIFRGYHPVIESCAFTKGGEWVTGAADGALGLWSAARKKPLQSIRAAHSAEADASPLGSIGGNAAAGVLSVAVCPASDLVATGAGDGLVRLWSLDKGTKGTKGLSQLGGLPARGFVNGLAVARSGRFVAAGMGQEPRMGRWGRDGKARNGVLILPLTLRAEDAAEE